MSTVVREVRNGYESLDPPGPSPLPDTIEGLISKLFAGLWPLMVREDQNVFFNIFVKEYSKVSPKNKGDVLKASRVFQLFKKDLFEGTCFRVTLISKRLSYLCKLTDDQRTLCQRYLRRYYSQNPSPTEKYTFCTHLMKLSPKLRLRYFPANSSFLDTLNHSEKITLLIKLVEQTTRR
ncbi:MAG: hypothetical protein S4CHLAM45_09030 [Chlamydiales bacterium]|nr:hypothetical protein [Chlamydiales bacterium]MCH9620545.1 hypothetical protein [Chlamydiales bacterium]MCH9623007.1 hypothetical protein [Chlamydiales bacterium]